MNEIEHLIFETNVDDENYFSNVVNILEESYKKSQISTAKYNYYYGALFYMVGDLELALDYTLKSYELSESSQTMTLLLLSTIYQEIGDYSSSLKFGLQYYDINPDDEKNILTCAISYYELNDIDSAFEMIKNVDYLRNVNMFYWYILISIKSENSNKNELVNLCLQNKEEFKNYDMILLEFLKLSVLENSKQLNDYAFNTLKLSNILNENSYYKYFAYFYRMRFFIINNSTKELQNIFLEIKQDEILFNSEDYSLKEMYLSYFYNNQLGEFKDYLTELIIDSKTFASFLEYIYPEPNKYLELVFNKAIEYMNFEYTEIYGSTLLFGSKGIKQDVEKARKIIKLSNDYHKSEYKKDNPSTLRLLSDLEIVDRNYKKATELALQSTIHSHNSDNWGLQTLIHLIIDNKTEYDLTFAKELVNKSFNGYRLQEDFNYYKMEHVTYGINELYAYFAIKGEKDFSKHLALEKLKKELEIDDTDYEIVYYIARLLKSLGQEYDYYQNKFLNLLSRALLVQTTDEARHKNRFFKTYSDIDNCEVVLYNINSYLEQIKK